MARVQYGSVVDRIDGKVGGHVFQKCGQSFSLRSKPAVIFSQSAAIKGTRFQFSSLASLWRSITLPQKQSFASYASTYPTYDRYGNKIILTPYQLFMYLNRPLVMAGYSPVTTCVAYSAPPIYRGYIASLDKFYQEFIVECDGYNYDPYVMLIYASPIYVAPKSVTLNKTVYCGLIKHEDYATVDIYSKWSSYNPSGFVVGMSVLIECWWLNFSTGCMVFGNKDEVVCTS